MSERGNFRGRGGGNQRGDRGGRGGGERGGRGGGAHGGTADRKPRENILDLTKYMDKQICVKFSGGREITGLLKGYDQLMNLTLDKVTEITIDKNGTPKTNKYGLMVARGTLLVLISPVDGSEEIENPFIQQGGSDDDDDDDDQ